MANRFTIYSKELQKDDLDHLRSDGFSIVENSKSKFTVEIPEGWEMQQFGCISFLVYNDQGKPILNYMRGNGLFFRE